MAGVGTKCGSERKKKRTNGRKHFTTKKSVNELDGFNCSLLNLDSGNLFLTKCSPIPTPQPVSNESLWTSKPCLYYL